MVMENFIYDTPTKIYFGKGQIKHLSSLVNEFGNRVLLVYGGGSIKENGIYDQVLRLLPKADITELSGVEPNPRIETVRKGAKLCQDNQIDVVLGVGGGSVIDCSKVIAAASKYDGDAWDLVKNPNLIQDALPILAILTASATGTEMNFKGVISNMETNEKIGTGNKHTYPYASICDPTYTYTVSPFQTAAGTADIMSHTFEIYFQSIEGAFIQDRLAEAVIQSCLTYLPIAIKEPKNYEARSNLMWASTVGLNGWTRLGKDGGWSCHPLEHPLSAYYDITHGAGLAVLTPRWMNYILNDETVKRFAKMAEVVFGIKKSTDLYDMSNQMIQKLYEFYLNVGLPMTLPELGIKDNRHFEAMASYCEPRLQKAYVPLSKKDAIKIYEACMTSGVN